MRSVGFYENAADEKGERQQSGDGEDKSSTHTPLSAAPAKAEGYRGAGDFSGVRILRLLSTGSDRRMAVGGYRDGF